MALSPMPGAKGDYTGDLEHIASWTPAFVISLVANVELYEGEAQTLAQDIVDHGTRFVHMPVRSGEVPGEAFESDWPKVSEQARRALMGGGRVLVHCREGCGRAGMVVLRLMIEAGEAPDEALTRLRAVRPCAIETDAQMRWAWSAERGAAIFLRHGE